MTTQEILRKMSDKNIDGSLFTGEDKKFSILSYSDNLRLEMSVVIRFEVESFNELVRFQLGEKLKVKISRLKILINENTDEENSKMNVDKLESFGLSVDVSVGHIEMSLTDVIAIEKGDYLISRLPVSNIVKLMIAGEVIANASFSFNEDEIILEINETFLKTNEILSDNNMD